VQKQEGGETVSHTVKKVVNCLCAFSCGTSVEVRSWDLELGVYD
jgi:hypothetical protein